MSGRPMWWQRLLNGCRWAALYLTMAPDHDRPRRIMRRAPAWPPSAHPAHDRQESSLETCMHLVCLETTSPGDALRARGQLVQLPSSLDPEAFDRDRARARLRERAEHRVRTS